MGLDRMAARAGVDGAVDMAGVVGEDGAVDIGGVAGEGDRCRGGRPRLGGAAGVVSALPVCGLRRSTVTAVLLPPILPFVYSRQVIKIMNV